MPVSTAGSKRAIFRQLSELISPHLRPKLARRHANETRNSKMAEEVFWAMHFENWHDALSTLAGPLLRA